MRFIRHWTGCYRCYNYLPVICQWLCKTSFTHFQFHYLHHVPFILRQSKETDSFHTWSASTPFFPVIYSEILLPKTTKWHFSLPMLAALLSAIGAMLPYLLYTAIAWACIPLFLLTYCLMASHHLHCYNLESADITWDIAASGISLILVRFIQII